VLCLSSGIPPSKGKEWTRFLIPKADFNLSELGARFSRIKTRIAYYGLKLPLYLTLIIGGLVLEFLIQTPIMIGFAIDRLCKRKKRSDSIEQS
jgi:hypothetical protein